VETSQSERVEVPRNPSDAMVMAGAIEVEFGRGILDDALIAKAVYTAMLRLATDQRNDA